MELTSLVRQLAIGQQENVMAVNQPRLCGIYCAPNHPIDACSTLQEIEQVVNVSANLDNHSNLNDNNNIIFTPTPIILVGEIV